MVGLTKEVPRVDGKTVKEKDLKELVRDSLEIRRVEPYKPDLYSLILTKDNCYGVCKTTYLGIKDACLLSEQPRGKQGLFDICDKFICAEGRIDRPDELTTLNGHNPLLYPNFIAVDPQEIGSFLELYQRKSKQKK